MPSLPLGATKAAEHLGVTVEHLQYLVRKGDVRSIFITERDRRYLRRDLETYRRGIRK